jgi:hypothetical protein
LQLGDIARHGFEWYPQIVVPGLMVVIQTVAVGQIEPGLLHRFHRFNPWFATRVRSERFDRLARLRWRRNAIGNSEIDGEFGELA